MSFGINLAGLLNNPYVIAGLVVLVIGIGIGVTFFPRRTLFEINPTSGEDPLQKKDFWSRGKEWNVRRRFIGWGAIAAIALLVFAFTFGWINVPLVLAAMQPTATPTQTLTSTPTDIPTPTFGPTEIFSPTLPPEGYVSPTISEIATATTHTIIQSVVQVQTRVVTKIVYQQVQVVITTTPGPTGTAWIIYVAVTASYTPTASETPSATPTASETSTPTETNTP